MWKTFKEFAKAIGKWWWAVVIDWLIGIGLGTAQVFGYATILPHWVAPAILFAGFMVACFIAVHRFRIERDEAIKRLSENTPNFKGHIEQIIVGACPSPNGNLTPQIILKMTVANTGAQSIADNFSLSLRTHDGNMIKGIPTWNANEDVKLFGQDMSHPQQILRRDRYMPTVALTPIQKGGKIFGYLAAVFPDTTQEEVHRRDNDVIVDFEDINEKKYSCTCSVFGSQDNSGEWKIMPGELK
jgi:hypothetical protein